MEKNMYVYLIKNEINGDRYIGKTISPIEERFKTHCYNASKGIETYLYRAMRKYGEENFSVELVETVAGEQLLNEREIYWIDKIVPEYNMTTGGDGGDTSKSPNYIRGMKRRSENMLGENNHFYGRTHSEKTKETMRKAHLGKKMSEETKRKLREVNLGKKMSAEAIAKTAEANSKIWYFIDPEGNEIEVKNLAEFCRKHGLDSGNMMNMYAGKYKTSKKYRRNPKHV